MFQIQVSLKRLRFEILYEVLNWAEYVGKKNNSS